MHVGSLCHPVFLNKAQGCLSPLLHATEHKHWEQTWGWIIQIAVHSLHRGQQMPNGFIVSLSRSHHPTLPKSCGITWRLPLTVWKNQFSQSTYVRIYCGSQSLVSGLWPFTPDEVKASRCLHEDVGKWWANNIRPPSWSLQVDAGVDAGLRNLATMLMQGSSGTDRAQKEMEHLCSFLRPS